jgi:predicted RNA-binding Zn ribbon-like protein
VSDFAAHPEQVVWLVADAAAELLSSPLLGRVRKCASQACVLYFADTSRRGTRRWCSMQVCGNREKAATHYGRRKSGS